MSHECEEERVEIASNFCEKDGTATNQQLKVYI